MDERRARKAKAPDEFEQQTAIPMLLLSLAIIPLLLAPVVFDLSPQTEDTLIALDWLLWAAFAVEYGIRLYLAPQKRTFVKTNKIDLVVIVLPFLRPLRVIRSARVLRLLRAARIVALVGRGVDAGKQILTRHKLHYALTVTLCVVVGSCAPCRIVRARSARREYQLHTRRIVVGGHNRHYCRLRRPLPGHPRRARGGGRADDRRHRVVWFPGGGVGFLLSGTA